MNKLTNISLTHFYQFSRCWHTSWSYTWDSKIYGKKTFDCGFELFVDLL